MNEGHPYDALTPDRIIEAVEMQGMICDGCIYPLNSYENRVYQIGIENNQPLIAKFYRPERWRCEQIQEEHNFCLELTRAELSVVAPLIDAKEDTIYESHGFMFALFERRGGYALEVDQSDQLEGIGRFLGRLHSIGQVSDFSYRPEINVESYAVSSQEFLLNSSFIPVEMRNGYEEISSALINRLKQCFAVKNYQLLRLHGDCHPGNILWRDNTPHVVDFDDARMGPAIQDLWMLLSGDQMQQKAQLATVLRGYLQFHTFDMDELALIEAFRTLRMIYYSAWLARRWQDKAFPHNFPWFNTPGYWSGHLKNLADQLIALDNPPLTLDRYYL